MMMMIRKSYVRPLLQLETVTGDTL